MTGNQRDEGSSIDWVAAEDHRRRLELELQRIRSEARAARLDARAAEIELMIREFAGYRPSILKAPQPAKTERSHVSPAEPPLNPAEPPSSPAEPPLNPAEPPSSPAEPPSSPAEPPSSPTESPSLAETGYPSDRASFETGAARPNDSVLANSESPNLPFANWNDLRAMMAAAAPYQPQPEPPAALDGDADRVRPAADVLDASQGVTEPPAIAPSDFEDQPDTESARRRPAAWLVSLAAHVGVICVLAAITLSTHVPRDQVSLAASAPETSEVAMETFTIESSEPENELAEPSPSEVVQDLSPTGELSKVDFQPDSLPAPPTSAATSLSTATSAAAMTLSSDSQEKIEFCGVEGGGNHFVYLVDSSGSMGDGFESARAELLRSIDVLKADQRFYVIFFDAEPDFMRLSDPNRDEPGSVYATSQNKAALKRWATRISMDRGKAPYDPLRFALKLKPDVVFLLSDGEFPQGIEDLLREENKIENLFGDHHPICIVHTIGYHSKEGESRMRRIAQQNAGQYRHIAPP